MLLSVTGKGIKIINSFLCREVVHNEELIYACKKKIIQKSRKQAVCCNFSNDMSSHRGHVSQIAFYIYIERIKYIGSLQDHNLPYPILLTKLTDLATFLCNSEQWPPTKWMYKVKLHWDYITYAQLTKYSIEDQCHNDTYWSSKFNIFSVAVHLI